MKKIAIKYGFLMFAGFTLFFLLMHLLGHSRNFNLRIFNGVIHIGLITLAIKEYRKANPDNISNYLSGVALGMYASLIGVVGFTIFMAFYLIGDADFMHYIQNAVPIGEYLNPITASLYILVEGVAVGLIGSYLVTRLVDMNLAKDGTWGPYHK
ncbi:MAG: DUF4199 domain-containing protein [Phaeodactylibacter sp.]|nr:DUF4199 domain-containing protein [Phaeodactylibacter sp.]MCB9299338.1 DUF4199 domain-containing protein [Lewinellaceae bacterium]